MGAGTVAVLDQMEKWAKQLKRSGGAVPAAAPAAAPPDEKREEIPEEDQDRMLALFNSELK